MTLILTSFSLGSSSIISFGCLEAPGTKCLSSDRGGLQVGSAGSGGVRVLVRQPRLC